MSFKPLPDDNTRRDMLVDMVIARVQAKRLWNLQRQGQVGTIAPIDGHEAAIVGAIHALDPAEDWVVPQYREPLGLRRYGPSILEQFLLYNIGHPAGGYLPDPIRVLPSQISLATQIPHAVGIAWGLALQNDPGVVLVFFGDGSSSEGDFYEAGNLAGVIQAPVIFLCINNQWAISTPTRLQTAAESFAAKAAAFGFPGEQVDGTDACAVYQAVANARCRAKQGFGPTLIEANLYRLGPHTTADDPTRYIPADELELTQRNDPIAIFETTLESDGLWNAEIKSRTERLALEIFDSAFEKANNTPLSPNALFDHCYTEDTQRLKRQKANFNDQPELS